jgi:hypothetical protein
MISYLIIDNTSILPLVLELNHNKDNDTSNTIILVKIRIYQ